MMADKRRIKWMAEFERTVTAILPEVSGRIDWNSATYHFNQGETATNAAAKFIAWHAKYNSDQTPAGQQHVLPGAEKATDATMAQRRADAPLRPKAIQRPCDAGLFGDGAKQVDLF